MGTEEDSHDHKLGLKEKSLDLYNKFKFPITLEPIVFFFTLSVGLNEVRKKESKHFRLIDTTLSDYPSQLDHC